MRECEDGADNTQKHVREREEDDDAEEYAGLAQLENTPCEIELDWGRRPAHTLRQNQTKMRQTCRS